jgi:hypothetical protein
VPKVVYAAIVFDAHNTAFAKLSGLEALGAEGVFCGSYRLLKFYCFANLKVDDFFNQTGVEEIMTG